MKKHLAAFLASAWLALAPAFAVNQAPVQTPTTGPLSATQFTATYLNPALLAIWSCNWGPSAPANGPGAAAGLFECWANTTTNPVVFNYYDGASWVTFGKLNTSTHQWSPTFQGNDLGSAAVANTGTSGHTLGFLDGVNTISAAWNMGTPSAIMLTNGTGLPIGTGVSGLGTGIATFLATPSSANLRAAVTDEVGTGALYFVGGALGTPASGTATNLTGLPVSSGISGLGTGIATALAVNTGSAGAPVLFNGAGGTPSSITLTNGGSLPISGIAGLGTGVGTWLATPSSANLIAALTDETGTGPAVFGTGPTISGLFNMSGATIMSTQSAPAQITSQQNDYNPSSVNCSTSSTLLINSNAAQNVTGLAGPTAGCEMAVINNGSFAITLKDESASSTAGNRFGFGSDLILGSKQGATLRYDGGASRWRQIGGPSASGGVGTVTQVTPGAGIGGAVVTTSGTLYQVVQPQGRLTLVSGTPVLVSDQTAKTVVYYDCYRGGRYVSYFDGTNDITEAISSCEVSMTMVSAASAGQVVSGQLYDVWWVNGGANRICLAMSASTGGGGGWASDTAGSSTARGTGYSQIDQTTRPYATNANSITNCFNGATNYGPVAANRGTYLGTIFATANGQTGMAFTPAATAGGTNNVLGLWNAYNRVPTKARNLDSTTGGVNLSGNTWVRLNSNANNRVRYVDGLAQSNVRADYLNCAYNTTSGVAGTYQLGVARDWSSGAPSTPSGSFFSTVASSQNTICPPSRDIFLPAIGLHSIDAVEAGSGATSRSGDSIVAATQSESLTVELDM